MITITESQLHAAIQIALGENKIYTEKLERTLVEYIKGLSTFNNIELKTEVSIDAIILKDNLNNQYIYENGKLYKKQMVEQYIEIK